jgi:galactose mutarotase-like enzyme
MPAGGPNGFHRQVWQVQAVEQAASGQAVTLSYTSKDGEEVCMSVPAMLSNSNWRWNLQDEAA